jgi:hypothetical protein
VEAVGLIKCPVKRARIHPVRRLPDGGDQIRAKALVIAEEMQSDVVARRPHPASAPVRLGFAQTISITDEGRASCVIWHQGQKQTIQCSG